MTVSNLATFGETTTLAVTTGTLAVPNNAALIISWTGSQTAPNQDSNAAITSAPSGMNFTQLARVPNGRRCTYVWIAVNTSGNEISGTYEVTQQPTGGGTGNGHMASFDLVTNVNTTTPNDAIVTATASGVSSIDTPDLGTPGTGDVCFAGGTSQLSGSGSSIEAGWTELGRVVSGANVRQQSTAYDPSDPQDEIFTYSLGGSANGTVWGMIMNAGSGGGGSLPPLPHVAGFGPDRYGPMTVLRM